LGSKIRAAQKSNALNSADGVAGRLRWKVRPESQNGKPQLGDWHKLRKSEAPPRRCNGCKTIAG